MAFTDTPHKIRLKRSMKADELHAVYKLLRNQAGHQKWWPGETPFEIMVGAILTQNTAWTNVEKAIRNLKQERLLTPEAMLHVDAGRLAKAIRPSGFYNVKVRRLQSFLTYLNETYDCNLQRMRRAETDVLRRELLAVKGIGPETADSILLYALDKSTFVIDAYTKRIFSRHGLFEASQGYESWRALFMASLKPGKALFNDYHAQIVRVAKEHCRAHRVHCDACPLNIYLK